MEKITTKDNSKKEDVTPEQHNALEPLLEKLNGKTLKDLRKENYLVIDASTFLGSSTQQEKSEKSDEQSIWDYKWNETDGAEEKKGHGHLQTYNIATWLGNAKGQIQVHSRFDESEQQYFLQHMLYSVFCPHLLEDPSHYGSGEGLDILAPLFPAMLSSASTENTAAVSTTMPASKGPSTFPGTFAKTHPFAGQWPIANACTNTKTPSTASCCLRPDTLSHKNAGAICWPTASSVTPASARPCKFCSNTPAGKRARRRPLPKNERCSAAAQNPSARPTTANTKRCANSVAAFSAAKSFYSTVEKKKITAFCSIWLDSGEEYLATLVPKNFVHSYAPISGGKSILTPNTRCIYPDFYTDGDMVLDAKYKRLEASKINRDNCYQMLSYMYILKARCGVLLYPSEGSSENFNGQLNGYGGSLKTYGLAIHQALGAEAMFSDFIEKMKHTEKKFLGDLAEICKATAKSNCRGSQCSF